MSNCQIVKLSKVQIARSIQEQTKKNDILDDRKKSKSKIKSTQERGGITHDGISKFQLYCSKGIYIYWAEADEATKMGNGTENRTNVQRIDGKRL